MRFVFSLLFLFLMETGVAQQQQTMGDRDENNMEMEGEITIKMSPLVEGVDFVKVNGGNEIFIQRVCYYDEDGEKQCDEYKHEEMERILREACQVAGYHKRILNCAKIQPTEKKAATESATPTVRQCRKNEPPLYYRVGNVIIESFFKDYENCAAIETKCFFDYENREPVCDEESYKQLIECRLNVVKVAEERFCYEEWAFPPPG